MTIIDDSPPHVIPIVGNQGNPIVIGNQNDEVHMMERRVPPLFFPRVMLRPAGGQPQGQAQAVHPAAQRRRREGNNGSPYRTQNDHCFNCGKFMV